MKLERHDEERPVEDDKREVDSQFATSLVQRLQKTGERDAKWKGSMFTEVSGGNESSPPTFHSSKNFDEALYSLIP